MLKDIIIFIIGIIVIVKSADLFTNGAEGIAVAFKIPRLVIGLTIVSLATTAPELTVSAISAHAGSSGIAIGNALGSCLANIGIILALAAIIRPINFDTRILREELPFLIVALLMLGILLADNNISALDGLVLLAMLVLCYTYIVLRETRDKRRLNSNDKRPASNINKHMLRFFAGAIGVVAAAKYAIVPSAVNIAHSLGVPEIVIGLSIVAIGTSLPELSTAIAASLKNMGEMAAGNVIGANIINILLVLGVSASINPLSVDAQTKITTLPVLVVVTLIMFLFSRTGLKLTRSEGVLLLAAYSGYIIYIFGFAYK